MILTRACPPWRGGRRQPNQIERARCHHREEASRSRLEARASTGTRQRVCSTRRWQVTEISHNAICCSSASRVSTIARSRQIWMAQRWCCWKLGPPATPMHPLARQRCFAMDIPRARPPGRALCLACKVPPMSRLTHRTRDRHSAARHLPRPRQRELVPAERAASLPTATRRSRREPRGSTRRYRARWAADPGAPLACRSRRGRGGQYGLA